MDTLLKKVLSDGGFVKPLIVPAEYTNGTSLFNPSVFVDGDKIYVNVRHCQYTLYFSETSKYEHPWGPLIYLHPENDRTLTTTNYICILDDDLNVTGVANVDTSALDVTPIWEFVGLEDARLFKWHEKYYLSGVRRDTTTNGQGRMELSEIVISDGVDEVDRRRIPPPKNLDAYCEKNWMPILDMPYHYIKWSNPTEVVRYSKSTNKTTTVKLDESYHIPNIRDLRGGSQVIPYGDGHIAITHEVQLWNTPANRKNGTYEHRFVYWDSDWKIKKLSDPFSFMGGKIEFCCGLAEHNGDYLITFGYHDNAAYIVRCPKKTIEDILNDAT